MSTEQLKKISLFRDFSEPLLTEFNNYFDVKTYEPETVIFNENDNGDTMFIILSGEIIIEKKLDEENKEFKELAVLSGGEFFGEMAMLENQTRFARARVSKPTTLYAINRNNFFDFMKQSPEAGISIYNGIMRTLLKRLRHTSNELTMLFDLSRQLMVPHKSQSDFLAAAIDEIKSYLSGKWNINAFVYNIFNEEYERCYEYCAYEQNAEEKEIPNKPVNGWHDNRNYTMLVERDNRKLACVHFCKDADISETEKNNLTTILNTISYIIGVKIVDVEHQAELALMSKLKKAKTYQ